MRIHIEVSVEPDRPDTPVVVESMTIRANPATPMSTILSSARTASELVRKAVNEARATDGRKAREATAR